MQLQISLFLGVILFGWMRFLDGNSPYIRMANNMSEALKRMVQNSLHPSEVAKVILRAITSENPDFRYIVGKDAAVSLEARRNMSDEEFKNLIKTQLNLQF